ncbi:MAG TPA: DUF4962 domain-containing protein [Acidobacteriaceae bacterium]
MRRFSLVLLAVVVLLCETRVLTAQDANEALGASVNPHSKAVPLAGAMKSLHSTLRPELVGVHPRVYFTDAELDALRTKAHGEQKAWWQEQLTNLRVLRGTPPPPPAEERRAQNNVAFAMAEAAFAYRMERNPEYLKLAKVYMDAAVGYDVWGYAFSKPNTDLAAGHLLYGMGFAYDLLYNDLTPAEREKYRNKIARQGHLMYEAFAPKAGRVYAYSQNHTFIPMAGLGVAAYAVYGEVPEAAQWAALTRSIYDRVLGTYGKDGYYYEGFEYWIFSTPWIIHYLDAHQHATGESLFNQPGLQKTHLYAVHSLTPGGQTMFDFGDVFEGPATRAHHGGDYERSHPRGKDGVDHFETNYNILYDLAGRFHSSEIQGVADWMKSQGHTNAEEWWTLAWRDSKLASQPIAKLQPWHHFEDADVVYWRSGWNKDATAVAFKCGPPEGHAAAAEIVAMPDWRPEEGHVHPDVNGYILWAHGQYLTGVSGYAGVPKTAEANTLLVDGHGQGNDGAKGHDAWIGTPYSRLNQARIASVKFDAKGFTATGEGAGAYNVATGLTKFTRTLTLTAGKLTVQDSITTSSPKVFTEFLHSDTTVVAGGPQKFVINVKNVPLHAELVAPADAVTKVEPNIVMGPGRPGSVDKGTLEQRGERLGASTVKPDTTANFHWRLTF